MHEEEHRLAIATPKAEPLSCEQVALEVDEQEWEFVEWREGTNETLSGWFIALARAPMTVLREEQWLLVEWPDEEAPTKYSLSTYRQLLQDLVHSQNLWSNATCSKTKCLNHYEGRNWRGFSSCQSVFATRFAERLTHPAGRKKNRPRKAQKLRCGSPESLVMWITDQYATFRTNC